ncbi:unnamed protein product [Paramecium sonneborni]|uniref:Uncharacterized protein n=1 Tax=Paramecium sonneborni TaxID=65129 RepID=A0A8S1KML1_9CILI|nr:unnamed protein product [Paramecium sonneborni]
MNSIYLQLMILVSRRYYQSSKLISMDQKFTLDKKVILKIPQKLIARRPYDPKQHKDIDKQGQKALSTNSAKVSN